MKRFQFVKNIYKKPEKDIWGNGSLWWNKAYNSGPWYLRERHVRDTYGWMMGVDDGTKGGGGRLYVMLDDATKDKILGEFEPYTYKNQKQITNKQYWNERARLNDENFT
jgi:hypothetical protein